MSENIIPETGAEGATESQGAEGAAPAPEPGISNAEAKKLPWVQDLMKSQARLNQLEKDQADEAARAEQAAAEAKGEYEKALEMEKTARKDEALAYQKKLTKIKLETEFVKAGLVDLRVVQLFEGDFDSETQSAADYVALVKADEANQLYFADPSRRPKQTPPASLGGPPDDFEPERDLESWIRSSDEKKRARAIEYNRQKYERQFKRG